MIAEQEAVQAQLEAEQLEAAKTIAEQELVVAEEAEAAAQKNFEDENVIRVQVEAELAAMRARLAAEEAAR